MARKSGFSAWFDSLFHPVRTGKKKARKVARAPGKAARKQVRSARRQKVLCSVCGRTVAGEFRHGRWSVGRHKARGGEPCSGFLTHRHKRAPRPQMKEVKIRNSDGHWAARRQPPQGGTRQR
jgi:hypothetical protein